MAGETLRDTADLLGLYADNLTGDISAVDGRDVIVATANGVGFLEDDPAQVPYTIPMTDGVPVDLLGTLVAPLFVGNFWKLDGNNAFVPSYTDLGITVPPLLQRLISGSVILNATSIGGGTKDYIFQGTEGGVFTGDPVTRSLLGNAATTMVFSGVRLYDVNLAGAVSLSITPSGHSDDLQVNDLRVALESAMV